MKIMLTEEGKKIAESLEIPKDVKGRFESIFINGKYDENAIHIKYQPNGLTLCGRIDSNLKLTSEESEVSCPLCVDMLRGLGML